MYVFMYVVGMNVLCMLHVCVYVCMWQIYGMSFMHPTTLYTFYNKDEDKLG